MQRHSQRKSIEVVPCAIWCETRLHHLAYSLPPFIDWIMLDTTSDKSRGIKWTLLSQLEDRDFEDDLAVLSSCPQHLQTKTELKQLCQKTGLNINTVKTQTMFINSTPTVTSITLDSTPLERVEDFTYLGSIVSLDNATGKDITARLSKAQGSFAALHPISKSKQYSLRIKVRIYNSNVKSVLYGSECWRVIESNIKKLNVSHNRCLRRICSIFWPNVISNEELYKKISSSSVVNQIKYRRLRWLGHVLHMDQQWIPKIALH